MSRRRRDQGESSLELLLDTITNAFGGILFLALLIVVLLQNTSKIPDTPTNISPIMRSELRITSQMLDARVAALRLEVEARESIAINLGDSALEEILLQLKEVRQKCSQLVVARSVALESISRLQEESNAVEKKTNELSEKAEEVEVAVGVAREKLAEERARRKINSPFPEERGSSKLNLPATVRYGRWYADRSPTGKANLDDFAILDNSGKFLTITPKPYRGVPIVERSKLSPRLKKSLDTESPSSRYIEIAIWDDSFDEFQPLRDYLVERGFEYRLVVVTRNDEVSEGYVPDAKVQ